MCNAAPSASTVPLAVSFNGMHYEDHTFPFTFHDEVLLREVSPAVDLYAVQCADDTSRPDGDERSRCPGRTYLGTLVTISGVHLEGALRRLSSQQAQPLYRCKFNHTIVPATLVSIESVTHVVKCHAPGSVAAGTLAPLSISLNAQDYSLSTLIFTFQQPELTTSIVPALGPSSGGTNVTISGHGLGRRLALSLPIWFAHCTRLHIEQLDCRTARFGFSTLHDARMVGIACRTPDTNASISTERQYRSHSTRSNTTVRGSTLPTIPAPTSHALCLPPAPYRAALRSA